MTLYATTRSSYNSSTELTVDYGKSYVRHYPSGGHRASLCLLSSHDDDCTDEQILRAAKWPRLPGWFNSDYRRAAAPAPESANRGFFMAAGGVVLDSLSMKPSFDDLVCRYLQEPSGLPSEVER